MEKNNPQLELALICYDKDGKVIEPSKEKGPHDSFLDEINEDVHGEPKIGLSEKMKEIYPNPTFTLVPDHATVVPGPQEVKRLVENDEEPPDDDDDWEDQPRYRPRYRK
jgi:hypothetical protein